LTGTIHIMHFLTSTCYIFWWSNNALDWTRRVCVHLERTGWRSPSRRVCSARCCRASSGSSRSPWTRPPYDSSHPDCCSSAGNLHHYNKGESCKTYPQPW